MKWRLCDRWPPPLLPPPPSIPKPSIITCHPKSWVLYPEPWCSELESPVRVLVTRNPARAPNYSIYTPVFLRSLLCISLSLFHFTSTTMYIYICLYVYVYVYIYIYSFVHWYSHCRSYFELEGSGGLMSLFAGGVTSSRPWDITLGTRLITSIVSPLFLYVDFEPYMNPPPEKISIIWKPET